MTTRAPDRHDRRSQSPTKGKPAASAGCIDLASGKTVDLGGPEVELWPGVAWIPDTRWVVVRPGNAWATEWIAVNTETGERIDIDVPGRSDFDPEFSLIVFQPDGIATE